MGEDRLMFKVRADTSVGVLEFRLDNPEGELIGTWEVERKTRKYIDKEENKEKFATISQVLSIPVKALQDNRDLYLVLQNVGNAGTECVFEWVHLHHSLPGKEKEGFAAVEEALYSLLNLDKGKNTTPIMHELKTGYGRETRVFEKGNWMVLGEVVEPGVPDKWNSFDGEYEDNRLGFARWLFDGENPLTARVAVNRFWEQLFGLGLVETVEDFGSLGEGASHPELLDWLAVRFGEDFEWDIKRLLKKLVMSATYRQSSHFRDDLKEVDPKNILLARGPRNRMKAEEIRDQALAVGGLLSGKMLGPSVMPEQPDGIWQVVYSGDEWKTSKGEDRHRRALYTFWRRTSPYPSFIAFDAASRELCIPRRTDTNTPLQALVTLNDPVYVEAAQALARRVIENYPSNARAQLSGMYSLAMLRGIDEGKLNDLEALYWEAKSFFEQDEAAICQLVGEENEQLAILTVMANTIMNLDEFLMKS